MPDQPQPPVPFVDIAGTRYVPERPATPVEQRLAELTAIVRGLQQTLAQQPQPSATAVAAIPPVVEQGFRAVASAMEEVRGVQKVHTRLLHELQGTADAGPNSAPLNLDLLIKLIRQQQEGQTKVLQHIQMLMNLQTTLQQRLSKAEDTLDLMRQQESSNGRWLTERMGEVQENVKLLVELLDQQTAPSGAPAENGQAEPPLGLATPEARARAFVEAIPPSIAEKLASPEGTRTIVEETRAAAARMGFSPADRQAVDRGLTDLAIHAATEQTLMTDQAASPGERKRPRFLSPKERRVIFDDYIADHDATYDSLAAKYDTSASTIARVINEVGETNRETHRLKQERNAAAAVERMLKAREKAQEAKAGNSS